MSDEEQDEGIDPTLNWVASYPKSGNTWIRLVARTYSTGNGQMGVFGRGGDLSSQIFHEVSPVPLAELSMSGEVQVRPAAMLALAHKQSGPGLVKSHHGRYTIEGMDLWRPLWTGKVVVPVRDPRDVCCSANHHFAHDTYEETAEFMATEGLHIGGAGRHLHHFIGSWSQHVRSWLDCDDLDVLVVRYEDMQSDPIEAFGGVMQHLLEEAPDMDQVKDAVEKCHFDRLRSLEDEHGFPETPDTVDRFFRKGQSGGWQDELPDEVARTIEEDHGEGMSALGYLQ